mgnify:CR=1 FL=1
MLKLPDCLNESNYWVYRGNRLVLSYIGPENKDAFSRRNLRKLLWKKGALAIMWNYDCDYTHSGNWYRCICDDVEYDETKIVSRNVRHNLRRSLNRCIFKEITFDWLAENGYETYANASKRFNDFRVLSKKKYRKDILKLKKERNRIAYGVFVDEALAAYATLIIVDDRMFGDTAYFDPRYSNAYPMYCLYYMIAKECFRRGYREFDRGTKPLLHDTNVDEFLVRLGYRISYCRLGVYYSSIVEMMIYLFNIAEKINKNIVPDNIAVRINSLKIAKEISLIP